jgi:hypothetical protein
MITAGTILSAKVARRIDQALSFLFRALDKSRGVAPHHRVDTSECIVQPAESGKVLHTEV